MASSGTALDDVEARRDPLTRPVVVAVRPGHVDQAGSGVAGPARVEVGLDDVGLHQREEVEVELPLPPEVEHEPGGLLDLVGRTVVLQEHVGVHHRQVGLPPRSGRAGDPAARPAEQVERRGEVAEVTHEPAQGGGRLEVQRVVVELRACVESALQVACRLVVAGQVHQRVGALVQDADEVGADSVPGQAVERAVGQHDGSLGVVLDQPGDLRRAADHPRCLLVGQRRRRRAAPRRPGPRRPRAGPTAARRRTRTATP